MAKTFNYGNGVWATKTGSSMAYNDENDNYKPLPFSVTRDSIATRVNKQGLIEVVGKDKLRIDYTDSDKGVALLEPSRTNLVTQSNNTTTSTWSHYDYGGGLMVDTYGYPSPNGKNEASRLVYTNSSLGSGGALLTTNITYPSASGVYTMSLWAKSVSGTKEIRFSPKNTSSAGLAGSRVTLTNEWKRYTFTFTNDGATDRGFQFRITDSEDSGNRTFDVWGMTIEEGSYATSTIPTSGSTVQRQADVANGAGNAQVFNDSEGVLSVNISALAQETSDRYIAISDGTTSNRIRFGYTTPVNSVRLLVVVSSSQVDFTRQLSDTSLYNKFAIKYKQNDFAIWANGFEIGVDASGNTPNGLSELDFDNGGGGADFYGKTKEIGYYDTALTDAELEYLTSYRSLNELVTELNLNTL